MAGTLLGGIADFIGGMAQGQDSTGQPVGGFGSRLKNGLLAADEGFDTFTAQQKQTTRDAAGADAFMDFVGKQKQLTAGGKAADAFRDFIGGDNETALGVHDSAWKNFSPMQKIGRMQGIIQGMSEQLSAAKVADFAEQARQRKASQQEDATAFDLFKNFTQFSGSPAPSPMAPGFQDEDGNINPKGAVMMAFSKTGQTPGAALNARSVKAFMDLVNGDDTLGGSKSVDSTPKFVQGPNGETVMYQPGTKNPAGFSPVTKANATAEAKVNAAPAEEEPGDGPKLDKSGKFYWDTHLKSWKPIAGQFGVAATISDLLNGGGAGATPAAAAPAKDPLNLFGK